MIVWLEIRKIKNDDERKTTKEKDVQKILEERFKELPTTFKPMSARAKKDLGMD